MASDATRKMLKRFGVAVTELEDAMERRATVQEIGALDAELATQMRETFAYVDQLRSRRLA